MTIRKKWILTLSFIAIISILVNSSVLSILTSHYFNQYLDETYQDRCKEIVGYLQKELSNEGNTAKTSDQKNSLRERNTKMEEGLDSYLGESITQIKVYDSSDSLIAQAKDDTYTSGKNSMSNMMGMMRRSASRGYDVVDVMQISVHGYTLGEVHITRFTTSANSYAAKLFQNSLLRNSLISLGIVILIVLVLGWFMSKRISKDLKKTARMAQEIDMGTNQTYNFSKTSEIRAIQQSLVSLGSRLKLKQKARKTLVDEMVHQTRTPLTILRMHLEGIEDGVIEMEPEEMKVCENQIQNLSEIITNISGLIEAGTQEKALFIENFELYQFLKQIFQGMKAQFERKHIRFEMLTTEKVQVTSDKYKIGQSIYNILTNAYKFTPENGKVTINYRVKSKYVSIEITDDGCGISKEEQKRIFEAYYKQDKETGQGGDGIGLFITKQNIEEIGGTIAVESIERQGSKFILNIPILRKSDVPEHEM